MKRQPWWIVLMVAAWLAAVIAGVLMLWAVLYGLSTPATAGGYNRPAFGGKPTDSRIPLKWLEDYGSGVVQPNMGPPPGPPVDTPSPNVKPTGPVHPLPDLMKAWVLIREAWDIEEAGAGLVRTFGPPPWRFEGWDGGTFYRLMIRSLRVGPWSAYLLPTIRVELYGFGAPGVTPELRWIDIQGPPKGMR